MSDWMICNCCSAVVQANEQGTCLGCQRSDGYEEDENTSKTSKFLLNNRKEKEENKDAIQESISKKVYVQPKTEASKGIRKKDTKGKEASKNSKAKEEG